MHQTAHKVEACSLKPWELRNADRICEHGDSVHLRQLKKGARKARRAQDRKECRNWN